MTGVQASSDLLLSIFLNDNVKKGEKSLVDNCKYDLVLRKDDEAGDGGHNAGNSKAT